MNMTARFYAILIGITLLLTGWNFAHYQLEQIEQTQLTDLVSYPIYAYVSDTTKVSPLLKELKALPEIAKVKHDTGSAAGLELVQSYNLPVSDEMLSDFRFPDVITIHLQPTNAARLAKPMVTDILRRNLSEIDIDAQSTVWTKTEQQLKAMHRGKIIFTVLIAVLLLLVFVYSRLSLELRILVLQKRKLVSVVDILRYKNKLTSHSLALFFSPLLVSAALYFIPVYYGWILLWGKNFLLPWWLFATQAGVLLLGTVMITIASHLMDHDNRYHRDEIQVEFAPEPKVPEPDPEDSL
ncbi:MAG TPA: hypothetical protein P5533_01620 [Candidatus Cloacimonadota bacterium]|nr:hypothetical protein [Candidatus Cloacimonadota bacterium]